MAEKNSTSATLRYFGSQLRLWRTKAGMSRERLAEEIGYSVDMVRSVEAGRRMAQPPFIEAADDVLNAGGLLKGGAPFLSREKFPDWFREYALHEAEAVALSMYECMLVPGLLQTAAYARALHADSCPPLNDEEIEQHVQARLERQAVFTRARPPVLSFVVEEHVLRRLVGGSMVMKDQIQRLRECAQWRNVSLQIMPSHQATHPGLVGPMVLVETTDHRHLVYLEGQRGSLLLSDADDVSVLTQRYGTLRSRALGPGESMSLMEKVAGEL